MTTSVTYIGANSFYNCDQMTSIIIPASVTTIGNNAFDGCFQLSSIIFENQLNLTSVGTDLFVGLPSNLVVTFYYTSDYNALSDVSKGMVAQLPQGSQEVYDTSCFNMGTKILCLNHEGNEEYISVERLSKGVLVKTYLHGYKRIGAIGKGFGKNNDVRNVNNMYKYTKTPFCEPLIITGGHSILVDDVGECLEANRKLFGGDQYIDDKQLLLATASSDFELMPNGYKFTYYHFILESDDELTRYGIWANGVLTETPNKKHFDTFPFLTNL